MNDRSIDTFSGFVVAWVMMSPKVRYSATTGKELQFSDHVDSHMVKYQGWLDEFLALRRRARALKARLQRGRKVG